MLGWVVRGVYHLHGNSMFVDEIRVTVQGGNGGHGSASFARRKYQPFAGPDGGDGGDGGDVVFVGNRNRDSLAKFSSMKLVAGAGAPGAAGLKKGLDGQDLEVGVPVGTVIFDGAREFETGHVTTGNPRLVVAAGGKGGRGNIHFKSSTQRAPERADEGSPGDRKIILLRYRIYCEVALMEPSANMPGVLLPAVLGKDPARIDYLLYHRKPRWVRAITDYEAFDTAYLPLELGTNDRLYPIFLEHAYWAEVLFINLLPLLEFGDAQEWGSSLLTQLANTNLRRLQKVVVLGINSCSVPEGFKSEAGVIEVQCLATAPGGDNLAFFKSQLMGGTIS